MRAKHLQRIVGFQAFGSRHLPRSIHAIDGRERDLLLLRILARGLAQRLGRLLYIQNVIDNLKRQPDMFAVQERAPSCSSLAPA